MQNLIREVCGTVTIFPMYIPLNGKNPHVSSQAINWEWAHNAQLHFPPLSCGNDQIYSITFGEFEIEIGIDMVWINGTIKVLIITYIEHYNNCDLCSLDSNKRPVFSCYPNAIHCFAWISIIVAAVAVFLFYNSKMNPSRTIQLNRTNDSNLFGIFFEWGRNYCVENSANEQLSFLLLIA